jgi:hypothetical protein
MVDDNSNYVREGERTTEGEFQTLETTIAACRKIVDDDLDHLSKPGMTAEPLQPLHKLRRRPVRHSPAGRARWHISAWDYGKQPAVKCARGARTFVAEVTPRVPEAIAGADVSPHDVE